MKSIHIILLLPLFCFCNVTYATGNQSVSGVGQFDKSTMIKEKLKKAQECINTGNFTAAKSYLDGVLKLDPKNAKAKELLKICSSGGKSVASQRNENARSDQNPFKKESKFSVSKTEVTFGPNGGSETLNVIADELWTVSTNPAGWGHLTRNGNTLTLKIDANYSNTSRTDFFKVKSGDKIIRVNISQRGDTSSNPYLKVSQSSLSFNANGGSTSITISSDKDWKVKTETLPWGHLQISGRTLLVTVDANPSIYQRTDYFEIQSGNISKRIDITQSGRSLNATAHTTPNYNSNYSSYNYSAQPRNWWKGRVKLGWNVSSFDVNTENLSWRTGLRLKFGKYSDWFNFIIGMDYALQRIYVQGGSNYVESGGYNYYSGYYSSSYYDYTYSEWKTYKHEIIFPLQLRLNFAKCGSYGRFYLGAGMDVGLKIAKGDVNSESTSLAFDPMLGIMWNNFDIGMDCRIYLQNNSYSKKNARFGLYAVWYF